MSEAGAPMSTGLPTPALRPCIDLWVDVGTPIEVGEVGPAGRRRVIPIVGGRAVGLVDGWTAKVLAGGADFQTVAAGGFTSLHARYVLQTEAGEHLYVENTGVRSGPPEAMARLLRGEPVDPAAIYFRCAPRFETAAGRLAWMTERLFVGIGARQPTQVVMRFFEIG